MFFSIHVILIIVKSYFQHVRESETPTKNFLRLEALVAHAVSPYLGYRGLYMGGPEPVIESTNPPGPSPPDDEGEWLIYKFSLGISCYK